MQGNSVCDAKKAEKFEWGGASGSVPNSSWYISTDMASVIRRGLDEINLCMRH
jgi:hypothetical protein